MPMALGKCRPGKPDGDSCAAPPLRPAWFAASRSTPGVALILAAVAAFFFVRQYATDHAESTAVDHTQYIAESVLPGQLRASDFAGPVSPSAGRELDRIANRQLLTPGILRVEALRPDGTVVYSSDHQLIGTRPDDFEEIPEIMAGVADQRRDQAERRGRHRRPTRPSSRATSRSASAANPPGVLELYADYGPIASDARSIFIPMAIGVAILLLGLYLSFFPILKRVTRTLRSQMEEIEHKAYHDDLTDLPNRTLFNDRAELALREAERQRDRLAVMLIDLDRFKDINDTLGHEQRRPAAAGARRRPPRATCARATRSRGWAATSSGSSPSASATRRAVLALAQKVRAVLAHPRSIDGIELAVDASIGIALSPEDGSDVETLMRRADVAMYRSKETHAPALYESEHDHYSPARLSLIADLHRAIGGGELIVDYQPQCDPASGELHRGRGAGALAAPRARPADAGRVHPARRAHRADPRADRPRPRRRPAPVPRMVGGRPAADRRRQHQRPRPARLAIPRRGRGDAAALERRPRGCSSSR